MIYLLLLLLLCNTLTYAEEKDLLNRASDIVASFISSFKFIPKVWHSIKYLLTDKTSTALETLTNEVIPKTFIIFEPTEQELAYQDYNLLLEPLHLFQDRNLDTKGLMHGLGLKITNTSKIKLINLFGTYFMKPEGTIGTLDVFPFKNYASNKSYVFLNKVIQMNSHYLPMRSQFDKLAYTDIYPRTYCTKCGSTFIKPDSKPIIPYKVVSIPVLPPPYTSKINKNISHPSHASNKAN